MKRPMIPGLLVAALIAGCATLSALAPAQEKPPDVLIIHAGGTPVTEKVTPANVDAVSCPTPAAVNCKTLAEQTAAALRKKKLNVKALAAGDVKNRDEILGARLVVLASPSYFGGVSWKMHKMFDERFFEIFVAGGERLAKKPFAALIMGKSEPKCAKSVEAWRALSRPVTARRGPARSFW